MPKLVLYIIYILEPRILSTRCSVLVLPRTDLKEPGTLASVLGRTGLRSPEMLIVCSATVFEWKKKRLANAIVGECES